MKIFGMIVALLIWLLTAFGCSPVKPAEQAEPTGESIAPTSTPWAITTPTPVPAATPTAAPVEQSGRSSGRSSSSHRSDSDSDSDSAYNFEDNGHTYPTVDYSDGEDTLMPEVGGDDDDDDNGGYFDDHDSHDSHDDGQGDHFGGHSEDTLLPEL